MSDYRPRVVDAELDDLLAELPAIALDGPKGVGKTETAVRRARTVIALDDAGQRELLVADPGRLERAASPVLVDEWQLYPPVWDLIRRGVDRGAEPGRFLLTGSASPVDAPTHSGAGRIVRLRMRPMALSERGIETPTVSLRRLLSGDRAPVTGTTELGLEAYAEEIVRSGFPGIRTLSGRARRAQLTGYLDRIVEHDFPEQGHLVRRPATLRAWLAAYAAATATTASYNAILDAATAGDTDKPAKTTTIAYRDVLSQLWLVEPVEAWLPTRNQLSRLASAPKHHLADPALAAALLGADPSALLDDVVNNRPYVRDGVLLGQLFESLVTLDLQVYAQPAEAVVRHLRTKNGGHEVDLIVERPDRRVLGVEVKLASFVTDADVKHLLWLRSQIGDDLVDAVVINTGTEAYRRQDGIAVIPAALLGP
ncbi:ATP-binding protein [Kribbella sp. NPDC055071]